MPVQDIDSPTAQWTLLAGLEEVGRTGWHGSERDLHLSLKDQEGSHSTRGGEIGPGPPCGMEGTKHTLRVPSPHLG